MIWKYYNKMKESINNMPIYDDVSKITNEVKFISSHE